VDRSDVVRDGMGGRLIQPEPRVQRTSWTVEVTRGLPPVGYFTVGTNGTFCVGEMPCNFWPKCVSGSWFGSPHATCRHFQVRWSTKAKGGPNGIAYLGRHGWEWDTGHGERRWAAGKKTQQRTTPTLHHTPLPFKKKSPANRGGWGVCVRRKLPKWACWEAALKPPGEQPGTLPTLAGVCSWVRSARGSTFLNALHSLVSFAAEHVSNNIADAGPAALILRWPIWFLFPNGPLIHASDYKVW